MRKHYPSHAEPPGTVDAARIVSSDAHAAIALPRRVGPYPTDTPTLAEVIRWVRSYPNERILRLPQVVTVTGRSRPAIWMDISKGTFPGPLALSVRARGWRESEVLGWIEARTILSRVVDPGFGIKDYVAALSAPTI